MSDRTQELPYSTLVGKEVGGVFIEAVLSRTERSLVLLGTQIAVDRPAVIKVFPKARNDTDADEQLLAEAGAMSRLRHANVVTLYSVGVYDNDFPYILMEYVPGETLKTMLHRDGALSPVRALGIVLQIVNAVEEMHRLGLRHGNLGIHSVRIEELKGSNQDLVKLVGFGLTGGVADEDDRVWYMTPEECTGGQYTNHSDIYVCGVILYQLLTGHMPYRSQSLEGLWDEIVSDTPPPLMELAPDLIGAPQLQGVLDRMLAKAARSRPSDARSLRLLLGELLADLKGRGEEKDRGRVFPVIHTVERMVPLPEEPLDSVQDDAAVSFATSMAENAFSAKAEPGLDSVTEVRERPDPSVELATTSSNALPSVPGDQDPAAFALDIGAIQWQIAAEARHRAGSTRRYAVLALHRPSGPVPYEISQELSVVMRASPRSQLELLVIAAPKKPESWLPWLSARARQYELVVGISVARRLDAEAPAAYTVRMALQAARRAPRSNIVAGRHAVDGLGLYPLFVDFDERRPGRYSSFLRYAGLAGT